MQLPMYLDYLIECAYHVGETWRMRFPSFYFSLKINIKHLKDTTAKGESQVSKKSLVS